MICETSDYNMRKKWHQYSILARIISAKPFSLQYTNGPSSFPSVVVLPSSVIVHTFKLEYHWSQLANLDQILCVASLLWGKGCIRFWGRLDQNSHFHGNRKPSLTFNGENNVPFFSVVFDPTLLKRPDLTLAGFRWATVALWATC